MIKDFRDDFLAKVLDAVTLAAAGATDGQITEIPIGEVTAPEVNYVLTAKAVTNGTAPGVSKTITVNSYLSDEKISPSSNVPTVLANRKTAHTALAVQNAANDTRQYEVVGLQRIKSQYLYISVDHTALAAGAAITFTLNLVRVR